MWPLFTDSSDNNMNGNLKKVRSGTDETGNGIHDHKIRMYIMSQWSRMNELIIKYNNMRKIALEEIRLPSVLCVRE